MSLINHRQVMMWDSVTQTFVPGDVAAYALAANVVRNNATLTNVTEFESDIESGKHYTFTIVYRVNDSAAEGIKLDLAGGTASVTDFWASYLGSDNAPGTMLAHTAALATAVQVDAFAGVGLIQINGYFTASSTGTFMPRVAKKAGTSALTFLKGSSLLIQEAAA